ncbi:MAG TPA: hypothetical protein VIF11_13970 [Methylomirabilota bacterium]
MAIIIPADLTIVSLRDGERRLPQRWTTEHAIAALRLASDLLKSQANIEFALGRCEQVVETMPPAGATDAVDESGYEHLAATYRAGEGVRVLAVDRAAATEIGAHASQQTRVCVIPYGADLNATSQRLAHGLGHLLALPHVDSGRSLASSSASQVAAWTKNLMYSGALGRSPELSPTQVQAARSSPLARRFGGR